MIASVGGAGHAPVASGTVGSALALVALWLIPFTPRGLLVTLVVVTVAGIWAAGRVERALGQKDPGLIVIDEVAGMTVAMLWAPLSLPALLAGFVLFRVFDIVKPWPAHAAQRLSGGLGVMVDDLIAGLYAAAVLAVARRLVGWP